MRPACFCSAVALLMFSAAVTCFGAINIDRDA
jgi:hypothetical protein